MFSARSASATARVRLLTRAMSSTSGSAKPQSTLEILQRKHLGGRIFTFNRPAQLNALNLDMIRAMAPQLKAWELSDQCNVIILKSDHPKAFCAGGDVKALVDMINAGAPEGATQFMREEYALNHLIATVTKPFVALIDGITMGGGVGLSVHAPFRVATERTIFAMPETAIGLFPDVGGTFFLPRLDGELGTYLALTGDRLQGTDVVSTRIATHYVPSERIQALTDRLCELEVSDWAVVNAAIEEFAEPVPERAKIDEHRAVIDRCFKHDSVEAIFKALEAEEGDFAKKTLATLRQMSPVSLHVSLKQVRAGKNLSIQKAFEFEWNLVNGVMRHPDFVTGVTAKLLTKPAKQPEWPSASQPASTFDELLRTRGDLAPLTFHRTATYDAYPHRHLALPSEADVKAAVVGDVSMSTGDYAFQSKEDVVAWFADNWPVRSVVADGANTLRALRRAAGVHAPNADDEGTGVELSVGKGKIGVKEHVRGILDRCSEVVGEGEARQLKWTWKH